MGGIALVIHQQLPIAPVVKACVAAVLFVSVAWPRLTEMHHPSKNARQHICCQCAEDGLSFRSAAIWRRPTCIVFRPCVLIGTRQNNRLSGRINRNNRYMENSMIVVIRSAHYFCSRASDLHVLSPVAAGCLLPAGPEQYQTPARFPARDTSTLSSSDVSFHIATCCDISPCTHQEQKQSVRMMPPADSLGKGPHFK